MGMGEAMIIAGVGCRKGATAAAVEAAIDTALSHVGRGADALALIATSAAKGKELGIMDTAVRLGVPLILVGQRELQAAGQRAETQSERVMGLTGVPSLAEAAALAAAGSGAKLLARRIAVGPATCALAMVEGAP